MPKRPATFLPWPPRTSEPATGTLGIKWATDARQLALEYGQDELAAAIARDLASLK